MAYASLPDPTEPGGQAPPQDGVYGDGRYRLIVPGVFARCSASWDDDTYSPRYYIRGRHEALIASGIVASAWFPEVGEVDKRGRTVRTRKLTWRGFNIEVTRQASGLCVVHFSNAEENHWGRARDDPPRETKVSWSDCAWRPVRMKGTRNA